MTKGHTPADAYDLLESENFERLPYLSDADWSLVPVGYRLTMYDYIVYGLHPGDLGIALFSNDLCGAAWRADENNAPKLADIADFIRQFTPGPCHGSEEAVDEWREARGLFGPRDDDD